MARTVFERIPEYFVVKYDGELCAWGRNLQKIGPVKSFILREGVFSDASPDPEMGPVMIQVKLRMRVTRSGTTMIDGRSREVATEITVCPESDADEQKIRNHCQKMERLKVNPRGVLTELPRAGVPFLPDSYR